MTIEGLFTLTSLIYYILGEYIILIIPAWGGQFDWRFHPTGEDLFDGNLNPSVADLRITTKLNEGVKLLDIKLLDHVIISASGYYSLADIP